VMAELPLNVDDGLPDERRWLQVALSGLWR
jgi:hypothetical protein